MLLKKIRDRYYTLAVYEFLLTYSPMWLVDNVIEPFYKKVVEPVEDFIDYTFKVIEYASVLRNDKDFGGNHILNLLQFKLLRVRKDLVYEQEETEELDQICNLINNINTYHFYIAKDLNKDNLSNKDIVALYGKQEELREKDKELLFNLLKENIDAF